MAASMWWSGEGASHVARVPEDVRKAARFRFIGLVSEGHSASVETLAKAERLAHHETFEFRERWHASDERGKALLLAELIDESPEFRRILANSNDLAEEVRAMTLVGVWRPFANAAATWRNPLGYINQVIRNNHVRVLGELQKYSFVPIVPVDADDGETGVAEGADNSDLAATENYAIGVLFSTELESALSDPDVFRRGHAAIQRWANFVAEPRRRGTQADLFDAVLSVALSVWDGGRVRPGVESAQSVCSFAARSPFFEMECEVCRNMNPPAANMALPMGIRSRQTATSGDSARKAKQRLLTGDPGAGHEAAIIGARGVVARHSKAEVDELFGYFHRFHIQVES